ncbi:uncharacterized protein J3D65DRAFT_664337 [Phyllosticta citribraziliensis]|uniref:Uncharacterized protein n=1 Tax=Phyllosticta citribraziliensis TaxID=989973 RepID=A0ABR1MD57_9PEZI
MVLLNFTRQAPDDYWTLDTENLPCPACAHEIDSFPIQTSHDEPAQAQNGTSFNPKRIANLMLQLLSINWQTGNFHRLGMDPPNRILQLSPEQCDRFLTVAKTQPQQQPPYNDAVLGAMCMLPYYSDTDESYKIVPLSSLIPIPEVDMVPDREIFYGGPLVPPHMLRLTDWWGGDAGVALFIDTTTGAAIELESWDTADGNDVGEVTKFEGKPHSSGEEVLQGWIDKFLNLTWVPDGIFGIFDATHDRHVEFLAHKQLLEKYGWPDKFPLPREQFGNYLHEKDAIRFEMQDKMDVYVLANRWHQIHSLATKRCRSQWEDTDRRNNHLDETIGEILVRYALAQTELAFARAAGEAPLPERARLPEIEPINMSSEDFLENGERVRWSVEAQPIDVLARAARLWHRFPGLQDNAFGEILAVLREAYDRSREKRFPAFELDVYAFDEEAERVKVQEERDELQSRERSLPRLSGALY